MSKFRYGEPGRFNGSSRYSQLGPVETLKAVLKKYPESLEKAIKAFLKSFTSFDGEQIFNFYNRIKEGTATKEEKKIILDVVSRHKETLNKAQQKKDGEQNVK